MQYGACIKGFKYSHDLGRNRVLRLLSRRPYMVRAVHVWVLRKRCVKLSLPPSRFTVIHIKTCTNALLIHGFNEGDVVDDLAARSLENDGSRLHVREKISSD